LVVKKNRPVVFAVKNLSPSVQTTGALVEEHLTRLQIHGVQSAVVVLDLDRPRLVVIVVLVCDVHNGGNDMGVNLTY
jgi:hypothetical protein